MSQTFQWEDNPLVIKVEVEERETRGARGRYGVPEEPDETTQRLIIDSVELFGVDITEHFDTNTYFNEEDAELTDHITETMGEVLA